MKKVMEQMVKNCIVLEDDYKKDNNPIEMLFFYDENGYCAGAEDITSKEVYEIKNPYFLSDTFIFCKKKNTDSDEKILYIKVNGNNFIEEIGSNFKLRFHFNNYNEFIKRKDVIKASPIHKIMFSIIGDEYWAFHK